MKAKMIHTALWALLLTVLVTACKKEKTAPRYESFDISKVKLEEYCIYTSLSAKNGAFKNNIELLDFLPGNKVKSYDARYPYGYQYSYTIVNDHTIDIEGQLYIITFGEDGKITAIAHTNDNFLFERPVLIKKPATDQLAGKTFAGRYYTPLGVDIHNKDLVYKFLANGKVEAGFDIDNPVRTENYLSIGNIAATNKITGMSNSCETMVLIDGKLEVNTWNVVADPDRMEYGTFTRK